MRNFQTTTKHFLQGKGNYSMVRINNRRMITPSNCGKKSCRKFGKITKNFSVKMLRDIILIMVELVEK